MPLIGGPGYTHIPTGPGPLPTTIAVVEDYEVRQTFNLDIDSKRRRFQHGDIVEVLREDGKAKSFRCRATGGKWEPVTLEFKSHLINKDLKKVEPTEMPGPVDEVKSYKATDNFDLVNGFPVTRGEVLDIQVRNGTSRAARLDEADLWTVAIDELRVRIKNGFLIPERELKLDKDWIPALVKNPFFIGDAGFPKDCLVEVNVKKNLIRGNKSSYEMPFDTAYFGQNLEAIPLDPAAPVEQPPEDPVLRGTPVQVALTLLPTIKEVFHWVPGHDWAVTSPRTDAALRSESMSEKVAITGQLDSKWVIKIVIDEDESIAILTEDTAVNTSHPIKDRSRAILNTHCWADFVGWLSVAASLATHPTKVRAEMFLTTKPVQIASNRWEEGHIIHVLTDESEARILELVAEGSLVPFTDGAIAGCEGCWHYNEGCTRKERWKSRKCDEWTLEKPPTPRLREGACLGCEHFDDRFDSKGNSIKDCAKRNDIEAREESCSDRKTHQFDSDNDIPF